MKDINQVFAQNKIATVTELPFVTADETFINWLATRLDEIKLYYEQNHSESLNETLHKVLGFIKNAYSWQYITLEQYANLIIEIQHAPVTKTNTLQQYLDELYEDYYQG